MHSSAALLLEALGQERAAERLHAALDRVLTEGPHTPDLGGSASTAEVTAAVAARLTGG